MCLPNNSESLAGQSNWAQPFKRPKHSTNSHEVSTKKSWRHHMGAQAGSALVPKSSLTTNWIARRPLLNYDDVRFFLGNLAWPPPTIKTPNSRSTKDTNKVENPQRRFCCRAQPGDKIRKSHKSVLCTLFLSCEYMLWDKFLPWNIPVQVQSASASEPKLRPYFDSFDRWILA